MTIQDIFVTENVVFHVFVHWTVEEAQYSRTTNNVQGKWPLPALFTASLLLGWSSFYGFINLQLLIAQYGYLPF